MSGIGQIVCKCWRCRLNRLIHRTPQRRATDRISRLDNGGWLGLAIIWTAFCLGVALTLGVLKIFN